MSIHDELPIGKGRALYGAVRMFLPRLYLPTVVLLVGVSAFSLGRLSEHSFVPGVRILTPESQSATLFAGSAEGAAAAVSESVTSGAAANEPVVASKSGSVYYLPWCPQVGRIKSENLVEFPSAAEARRAGYRPTTACKGVE